MTKRFTVKDVGIVFAQLCEAMNKEQGYDEGQWSIDSYRPGGANLYRIQEAHTDGRTQWVSLPFGHRYYTAKEFCLVGWFALDVVGQMGGES